MKDEAGISCVAVPIFDKNKSLYTR
ncbi:hypothetical protein OK016_26345 [Vibrio chagasii]|nr:hypothetical protein [Vibrio chagasii]